MTKDKIKTLLKSGIPTKQEQADRQFEFELYWRIISSWAWPIIFFNLAWILFTFIPLTLWIKIVVYVVLAGLTLFVHHCVHFNRRIK